MTEFFDGVENLDYLVTRADYFVDEVARFIEQVEPSDLINFQLKNERQIIEKYILGYHEDPDFILKLSIANELAFYLLSLVDARKIGSRTFLADAAMDIIDILSR